MVATGIVLKSNAIYGGWRVGRRLGGGGQGVVHEARPSTTKHAPPRALKAAPIEHRARLEAEIRLLESIDHPNILKVLDKDLGWELEAKSGEQFGFYVTERCRGSLLDLWELHRAPVLVLQLFRQVCEAVEYLHHLENPMIHRDIKPDNVLLADEPRRVVLADFGIARELDQGDGLTAVNEVVGTPYYRAPEVLAGQPADERSDIYSLGRTLEWMLTGIAPTRQQPSAPPDDTGLDDGLRQALREFLETACAADARQRFQSMREVLAALPIAAATTPPTGFLSEGAIEPAGASAANEEALSRTDPVAAYAGAITLLRTGDQIAWKQATKSRRTEVERLLKELDAAHATQEQPMDALKRALVVLAPTWAWTLAAVESGKPELAGAGRLMREMIEAPAWPTTGRAAYVGTPWALAYLFHHLHGAVALHAANPAAAASVAVLEFQRPLTGKRKPLYELPALSGHPALWGGDASLAWKRLAGLYEELPWLASFFGGGAEFREALAGYTVLLSFVEFAGLMKTENGPAAVSDGKVTLHVPPNFMFESDRTRERGFELAFPDGITVNAMIRIVGAPQRATRELWPRWASLVCRLARSYRGGLWPMSEVEALRGLP